MAMQIVTGMTGFAHITSDDDRILNYQIMGNGQFVAEYGEQFEIQKLDNNTVRILSGAGFNQGTEFRIERGNYEDVIIDNGSTGTDRNDIIVARYSKNEDTSIENVTLVVVKGETCETGKAEDPSIMVGNILDGSDTVSDMALYRVRIESLSIAALEPLFELRESVYDKMFCNFYVKENTDYIFSDSNVEDGIYHILVDGVQGLPEDCNMGILIHLGNQQMFIKNEDEISRIYTNTYMQGSGWGKWIEISSAVADKLGTSNVGSDSRFFYLREGTPKESSSNIGSENQGIYLKDGIFSYCTRLHQRKSFNITWNEMKGSNTDTFFSKIAKMIINNPYSDGIAGGLFKIAIKGPAGYNPFVCVFETITQYEDSNFNDSTISVLSCTGINGDAGDIVESLKVISPLSNNGEDANILLGFHMLSDVSDEDVFQFYIECLLDQPTFFSYYNYPSWELVDSYENYTMPSSSSYDIKSVSLKSNTISTSGKFYGDLEGIAEEAIKDENGNVIQHTYAKKSIYDDTTINVGRKADSTIGKNSIVLGTGTGAIASGMNSAVIANASSEAAGVGSVIIGGGINKIDSIGMSSVIIGGNQCETNKMCQLISGHYNDDSITKGGMIGVTGSTLFVLGNGNGDDDRSNAFRITDQGYVYAGQTSMNTGADYAEYFEWADGNEQEEDRVGYFVTFESEKLIRKANSGDYILGVVSGMPGVIGNGDECWRGRFILDDFGRYIEETFEYEEPILNDETGEVLSTVTKTATKWKQNPEYDPKQEYISRDERKEWSAIGMIGVLSVYDDGTCIPGGYCKCADGGIATSVLERGFDTYKVLQRISDNIVQVIVK